MTQTRRDLQQMSRQSTCWWQFSNALIDNAVPRKGIPPWKSENGKWLYDGKDKANNVASTVCSKYILPHDDGAFDFTVDMEPVIGFMLLGHWWALKILRRLREDQTTSPNGFLAMLLRRCVNRFALPIILIARICLRDSRSPKTMDKKLDLIIAQKETNTR